MSTAHQPNTSAFVAPFPSARTGGDGRALHQIGKVRQREGLSRRTMARRLGTDVEHIRFEENQAADMSLSRLYEWQAALGVPISELLADGDEPLSLPVLKRAQVLRLMKTAASLRDRAESAPIQRIVQMLIEQILEIMPEVKDVSAWNVVGQRRTLDELGAAADRRLSIEALEDLMD